MGSSLILIIILAVIVAALIGFVSYTYIRDKQKAKKEKKLAEAFLEEAREYKNQLSSEIVGIVNEAKNQLDNFQVSIGKVKMGDINSIFHEMIEDIVYRDRYKRYVLMNKEGNVDFIKHLNSLNENRPNVWFNKCSDAISFFEALLKEYQEFNVNNEFIEKDKAYIQEKFESLLNKRKQGEKYENK